MQLVSAMLRPRECACPWVVSGSYSSRTVPPGCDEEAQDVHSLVRKILRLLVDSPVSELVLGSKLALLALLFFCFRRVDAAPIWLACTRLVIVLAIVVVSACFH